MEMDDNKLKRLLQEGMEWEADCIMAEVNSDPNVKDLVAPEEIHDKLMQQIREHEQEKEKERENQAKEEEELIRLGKLYKKKRARRKYIVLIAAVVCALGVGTISFGDGKKVFTEIQRMLGDREQNVVNTDNGDEDKIKARDVLDEAEAYEQIEDEFGFVPVKMFYLPDGMEFVELDTSEVSQYAQICYEGTGGKVVLYRIVTDYRTGSVSMDIEDRLIQEYDEEIEDIVVSFKEYEVKGDETRRWSVTFVYKDAQYSIILTGIDKEEVEKIIENLYFS